MIRMLQDMHLSLFKGPELWWYLGHGLQQRNVLGDARAKSHMIGGSTSVIAPLG